MPQSQSPLTLLLRPLRTWLQLFRAPNLFTVPGDPVAGFFLACFFGFETSIYHAIGASLCFYSGGLLLNDLADLKEDRAERPNRPLPSGQARPGTVAFVMTVLFGFGLWLCSAVNFVMLATGMALLASIIIYNLGSKRFAVVGALNMGACRGLSLLLGATAVPHGDLTYQLIALGRLDHVAIAALTSTLFIAAVTNLARFETKVTVPTVAKWLPFATVAIGAVAFVLQVSPGMRFTPGALMAIAVLNAWQISILLHREPATPIPPQIGKLIRLLLILQAAFISPLGSVESAIAAAILLLLWPLSRVVGRWFYAS